MDVRNSFTIEKITDTFILLGDTDSGVTITNAAQHVIANLEEDMAGGLGKRKVYYRDTTGRFDELRHAEDAFLKFAPCSKQQQLFLNQFTSPKCVRDWGARSPFG